LQEGSVTNICFWVAVISLPNLPRHGGQSMAALPLPSDVNLLGNCKCIIHFNAKVAGRALDLRVTKKKLDGS
jgi:hypothetical protein